MNSFWDSMQVQADEAEREYEPVTFSSGLKDHLLTYLRKFGAEVMLGKEGVLLTEPKEFLLGELKKYKMPTLGNVEPVIAPRHESEHIVDFLELLIEELQFLESRYEF